MKLKAVILRNELEDDHTLWVRACEEYKSEVEYRIVNLTTNNWLKEIQQQDFDILLTKPGGLTAPFKQLYDERVFILGKSLGYKIFPSVEEIFIYENKRVLSYWLKANNIPHPQTHVFYDPGEALEFIDTSFFPVVAKANIGASGSGIKILKSKKESYNYIKQCFSGKGVARRTGPNLAKNEWIKRGVHYILHPAEIQKKWNIYKTVSSDTQYGFAIFQEYINHDFEWRVVRIGDSFFAHKKLKKGDKASGTLKKGYSNPPVELFEFVKKITDAHDFHSQAIDLFESERGYLVNEMQCIFGQSDPYQMLVDGNPGRYIKLVEEWIFEKGDFTRNECYNLRIEHILSELLATK